MMLPLSGSRMRSRRKRLAGEGLEGEWVEDFSRIMVSTSAVFYSQSFYYDHVVNK